MPKYLPIPIKIEMKASASDMVALYWRWSALVADFTIPGDAFSYLRVSFDRVFIIRTLDEMPISTEEESPNVGIVRDHFAYRMEEARFWETQSQVFRETHRGAQHYRFITGMTCLDVIAHAPPVFAVVPADAGPGRISN